MTDRGITAPTITELENQSIEYCHFVVFNFPTVLRYTTAPYNVTVGSDTYLSNHVLSELPDFTEQLKMAPGGIQITVAGSDINNHAIPLTNDYKHVQVDVYRHIFSTGENITLYTGFIDKFTSSENVRSGNSSVTWHLRSHWSDFEAVNGRLINDKNQQELYPGDLGFEFVGRTDRVLDYWGKKSFTTHNEGVQQARDWINNHREYYENSHLSTIYPDANRLGYYFDNGVYDWQPKTVGSANYLPVVYGEASIKGTPIFRDVTGADGEYLWVVYALAEGECDSLVDVKFNGSTYTGYAGTTVTFYPGTTTQTVGDSSSGLDTASVDWTSAHRCRGVACVVIRYTYDENVWEGGEPQPQFILRGKKCTPIGGGGAVWTKDPVTIAQDYLTNSLYGKGLTTAILDNFSNSSSYVYGTATEHGGGAGTIRRFEFNGVIQTSEPIKKNLEKILFNMNGHLPWISGKYKLVIERDDETTPVYTFTEDHFVGDFKVTDKSLSTRANAVYYTFSNPAINYADSTEYTQLSSAIINTEDAGKQLRVNIKNKYETNKYRAKNRSSTILKVSRNGIGCEFTVANNDAIRVETGDVIAVTRTTQGWSGKLFRVLKMVLHKKGRTSFVCLEYDPTNYDWTVNPETPDETTTTLTNPLTVPAPTTVTVASGATHQIIKADGTTLNRMLITIAYTTDDATIHHYEVEYKESTDATGEYTKLTDLVGYTNKTCYISGVREGVQYNVRVRAVNSLGVTSSWTTATAHTVGGEEIIGYDRALWGTDAYANGTYYVRYLFDTLTPFIKTAGVYLSSSAGVYLQSTGVIQYIYKYQLRSPVVLSWDKNRRLKCKLLIDVYTGLSVGNSYHAVIGNYLSGYVGLKIEYNGTNFSLKCMSFDGTTVSTGGLFGTFAAGTELKVLIEYTAGVGFAVYTDDGATTFQGSKTTNIPSDSVVPERRLPFEIGIDNTVTTPRLYVNDVTFLQENA